jgi:hypothetical protein
MDAVEAQRPGTRVDEPDDRVDRCAFPGSIRSEITKNFSAPDMKVHAVEREESAIAFRQSAGFEHAPPLSNAERPSVERV